MARMGKWFSVAENFNLVDFFKTCEFDNEVLLEFEKNFDRFALFVKMHHLIIKTPPAQPCTNSATNSRSLQSSCFYQNWHNLVNAEPADFAQFTGQTS